MRRAPVSVWLVALASACATGDAEDWRAWFDDGAAYDVAEPLSFTEDDYAQPRDGTVGIATLRDTVLDHSRSNDGPVFAPDAFHDAGERCQFWGEDASGTLPATIEGIVTSHPRVYRKIEGCDGDEKYYGSFWMEDATGGIFVLADTKVAHFDMGAKVTLHVRSMRRRYGLDMVYVHDVVEVDPGPHPIHFDPVSEPLEEADQSRVVRFTGTVVTEPTTFGEVLVQPEGREGTCGPDDLRGRENCFYVNLDQELGGRGITLQPGERIRATGPVSQSAWFGPTGVYNFYGVYLTRVGQLERLDPVPSPAD